MAATTDTVRWRGVNHLALVTADMDATVRFWHGVLDARLVTTLATPAFRHYFFEIAQGNTVAFFEYTGQHLDAFAKPAGVPYEKAALAAGVSHDTAPLLTSRSRRVAGRPVRPPGAAPARRGGLAAPA